MATHTIAAGEIAKHGITLVAATVDTVTFADTDVARLAIHSDGVAAVYYTLDGSTPSVGGANSYPIPAALSIEEVEPPTGGETVVKLISAGTPTLAVVKLR